MAKKETDRINREEQFKEFLRRSGLRVTPERINLINVMSSLPQLFTIDQLYEYMAGKAQFPVSRATCYNNVRVMLEAGILIRHRLNDNDTRYELRREDTHFLAVCIRCGIVRQIRLKNIALAARHICIKRFHSSHMVSYIYGICEDCKFEEKKSSKSSKKT